MKAHTAEVRPTEDGFGWFCSCGTSVVGYDEPDGAEVCAAFHTEPDRPHLHLVTAGGA